MCELACQSGKGFFCPALPFGQRVYAKTKEEVECPPDVKFCKAAESNFASKAINEIYMQKPNDGQYKDKHPNNVYLGSGWKRVK